MLRYPDFLIVGAMKAGTTTLHADLGLHPSVYTSDLKELAFFSSEACLESGNQRLYKRHFEKAASDQICGEASTQYTKIPQFTGSAERAASIVGPDLKIIYAVREPLDRIVSHYVHEFSRGATDLSIDDAVRSDKRYIAFSSYYQQIKPWVGAFGRGNVAIVVFEEYMRNRGRGLRQLCDFLGIDSSVLENRGAEELKSHLNHGSAQYRVEGAFAKLITTRSYRAVRRYVPENIRKRVQRAVGRRRIPSDVNLSLATRSLVTQEILADQYSFIDLLGIDSDGLWEQWRGGGAIDSGVKSISPVLTARPTH
ncbi:sulfotransferase family protein [Algiphilus aromaticivorans]|uniref:sulfotransferase family protein n=1 Tax=Algiphilus aromaticivorans TaxID=382454 RepID=UPI000A06FB93|nr:sulfotransferase domain-containing protein [Algiphilus aromaticivorans]